MTDEVSSRRRGASRCARIYAVVCFVGAGVPDGPFARLSDSGRTMACIQMSDVFAELELRITRERVRSGMRNARARGGEDRQTADHA